jgi:Phosphotransferase enzyme family
VSQAGIPRIAPTVAQLISGAVERQPVTPEDARSGSTFERVRIAEQPYFLKCVSYAGDWIMRVTGDTVYRTYLIWRAGIMDGAPSCIDHTVVGMALEGSGPDAVLGMLMHDVGDRLVPPGDAVLEMDQHLGFLDHLAALCATFWGWQDPIGLTTMAQRLRFFAPDNIAPELARPDPDDVLTYASLGWERLAERDPATHTLLTAVHKRPEALCRALATTPVTFLQGDWKLGNLGSHADGRTILLDWAYPGSGPACWDLAWILSLNRARLPASKEDTITAFEAALHRHGIDTNGWFDRQLRLCLFGMTATMGWEKALGDDDELGWWVEQAERGAGVLHKLEGSW